MEDLNDLDVDVELEPIDERTPSGRLERVLIELVYVYFIFRSVRFYIVIYVYAFPFPRASAIFA